MERVDHPINAVDELLALVFQQCDLGTRDLQLGDEVDVLLLQRAAPPGRALLGRLIAA